MNSDTIPSHAVVRRIDDLGRIVINRELRKKLRIRDGNPLAMWIENGQLRMEKYQEVQTIADIAEDWVLALAKSMESQCVILVTDRDRVVAAKTGYKFAISNGHGRRGRLVSNEVQAVLERGIANVTHIGEQPTRERAFWLNLDGSPHTFECDNSLIVPIASLDRDSVMGTVVMYSIDCKFTESEHIIAKMLAAMIASSIKETG